MASQRHTPEQTIGKLGGEAEIELAKKMTISEFVRKLELTAPPHDRWWIE